MLSPHKIYPKTMKTCHHFLKDGPKKEVWKIFLALVTAEPEWIQGLLRLLFWRSFNWMFKWCFISFFEEAMVLLFSHAIFLLMFIKLSLMSLVPIFSTICHVPSIPSNKSFTSNFWLIYFLYPKVTPNYKILFLLKLS